MLSQHDLDHMDDIMAGYGDWFSAQLLRLIAKADLKNRARLSIAFPEHVAAFEAWERGDEKEES